MVELFRAVLADRRCGGARAARDGSALNGAAVAEIFSARRFFDRRYARIFSDIFRLVDDRRIDRRQEECAFGCAAAGQAANLAQDAADGRLVLPGELFSRAEPVIAVASPPKAPRW